MQIEALKGDITRQEVDAIVNAANESLLGGGGVDGAIHRAAGPKLVAECQGLGGCSPGDAKLTSGYRLPAAWVIHTVGPRWGGGNRGEAAILRSCYEKCLALAEAKGLNSIAFPAISTGIFGYPLEAATEIAVATARAHQGPCLELIRFVCFDDRTLETYRRLLAQTG
jgi:O-acetyl-ADP-ribose deacetylase (regulator of RNase III)